MINQKSILFLVIFFSLFIGCEKWPEQEIYKRPDWLPGKLYTTVSVQEDLTMFAECLRLTKLDSILDVSGSWTVFAPTDEAMKQYLSENQYAGISDIPSDELEKITEFHIIQNPWSLEQLQILSANGWRTDGDANWYSYAFKRETMLKNPVEKYWIKRGDKKEMIVVDSTISDGYRRVFVESRKYVPIFYDEYMDVNGLTSEDYSFYFGRDYEWGNIYFADAKILHADIFAENGFVHIVDKVVNPMLNAKELLERKRTGESYRLFLEMVYWHYPNFDPNIVATYNQESVRLGGLVDTLWNLDYNGLEFALQKERIGYKAPDFNETVVSHNGLYVPTDDAFRGFVDDILTAKSGFPHWPDYKSLPRDVLDFVIAQHFKPDPLFPSTNQYKNIFRRKGRFQQNEEAIIRKEFGSNCTFIGLNAYNPDRVFTSVTGPVFLRPQYSLFRRALLYTGAHDIIAKHEGELYFFPIPDYILEEERSLILNWIDRDANRYNFLAYHRTMQQTVGIGRSTLRNMLLNHVGTPISGGSNGKEVIRTLRGNLITWDHSDNTIRGTRPTTKGYGGYITVTNSPVPLEEPADNGKTWSVRYWLNF